MARRREWIAVCHLCGGRVLSGVTATKGQAEDAAMTHFLATHHRAIVGRQYEPVIYQERGS